VRGSDYSSREVRKASGFSEVTDDGGWCWFHEPRSIVVGDEVWLGAVSSGSRKPGSKGQVIALRKNLRSGSTKRYILHSPKTEIERNLWANDHSAPALLQLQNKKILAAYSLHGKSNTVFFRTFSFLTRRWSSEKQFVASEDSKITYSNLVFLSDEERIYDFFRGLGNSWKPSWAFADAKAIDWKTGGILIDFPHEKRHRPYLKVGSNGKDTIHFAYTEGHPRDFPNSVYHVFYRSKVGLCGSDGRFIAALESGLKSPDDGTLVFKGDANHIAWVIAVNDFGEHGLFVLFSVRHQEVIENEPPGLSRISYWVATYDGSTWRPRYLAEAGPQLYKGEEDYSGLFAQHPSQAGVFFISTKVDPSNGSSLKHWEIFEGITTDWESWSWRAVTENSDEDNLRPIVTGGQKPSLIWLRGQMNHYADFSFRVATMSEPPAWSMSEGAF
jgi:hypothetical protein